MTEFEANIRKKVFERYPKTKKELNCWQERQRLQQLRDKYRLQLIQEKRETQTTIPETPLEQG